MSDISVIGSADGPTSIFLAGELGRYRGESDANYNNAAYDLSVWCV